MPNSSPPYPSLGGLRVVDAMHPGLISCSPDTPLRTVARMDGALPGARDPRHRSRSGELPGGGVWGVVSDADLFRAAQSGELDEQASRVIAATPMLTVTAGDELGRAALLMVEHEASHLIVVEPHSARPIGVLSTLDIARALAGFPESHPAQP